MIVWLAAVAIKYPTIKRVAAEFGEPRPDLVPVAFTPAGSVLILIGLVMLPRRVFSGRWWARG